MTPEQQGITIAEACGWTDIQINFDSKSGLIGKTQSIPSYCHGIPYQGYDFEGSHRSDYGTGIPDYCNDLNAMHEAERTMGDPQLWDEYQSYLSDAMRNIGWIYHATAAQRAEAFLRTIGKWGVGPW